MNLEKKKLSFNKKIPKLQISYLNAKIQEDVFYQEKRHLELLFAQTVISCDYNRIPFLIRKLFSDITTDNFENPKLIYNIIATTTLLTRIVIIEGVCEKEAYSLSDAYLSLNFKELTVTPSELILEIFKNFMILIENLKFYKFESQLVNLVIIYVNNNINNRLTINSIADSFHISPEYLSSHFKTVTNMSLNSFINQEKIELAKYLLSSTELTLLEISMTLGYNDQSYFTKTFKKHTKTTPSRYRKNGVIKFKKKGSY